MILGRTDLRMGASKAKFDSGNDFEVRSAVDPRKPHEKLIYRSENFFEKKSFSKIFFEFFFSIGNRSKCVLAKFRGLKTAKKRRKTWKKRLILLTRR